MASYIERFRCSFVLSISKGINSSYRKQILLLLVYFGCIFFVPGAHPQTSQAIEGWIRQEFKHSTLNPSEQTKELNWFKKAAQAYQGISIHVVSEDIATHRYESEVLAKVFFELTGIHVVHEITKENDVVNKMQIQMELGLNLYDAYVNDADFIGTHSRYSKTIPISEMITTQWRNITLPTLDLEDFIGLEFVRGIDGRLYQLPTQQFVNLYWYRHDWFSRPDIKKKFMDSYGYPLEVPQNWEAYEDIADFFTNVLKVLDGKKVWGHMDYGGYDPSLGWRISDSWLNLAGVNDVKDTFNSHYQDNGTVGDWGIRVRKCHPVGASTARGGALDSPAAIYAVEKYIDWMYEYAPPEARHKTFSTSADFLSQGNVAQQIFWYTAFMPNVLTDSLTDERGNPLWRVAPSPRGKYWKSGMKSGYQDVGGWTFLYSTPQKRREAAWLYAQFVVSKTVSMSKLIYGHTPIRQSDIMSPYLNEQADNWGGLLEFYKSNAQSHWTPTGYSVPNYAALSSAWWKHIGPAVSKEKGVDESMRALSIDIDSRLEKLSLEGDMRCEPKLNPSQAESFWLDSPGSPWQKKHVQGEAKTIPYNEVYRLWHDLH